MSARVDPATLSQEIDETRADVGETLDALQAKLSPSQLLDQAVTFCSERGYELARRVGDTVREHPVPMALAGAGLLWYLSARRRRVDGDFDDYYYAEGYVMDDDDYDDDLYTDETSAGAGRTQRVRSAARSARRRASEAASTIKDRATGAVGGIKERASGAASTIRDGAGRASGVVRQRASRAGDGMNRLLHEQPLLVGAAGLVIGAAIAAIFPSSELEDELLGETSDRAFERAKQKGSEQYEKVRETVKRAAEGARRAVSESDEGSLRSTGGYTPGSTGTNTGSTTYPGSAS
jgi:ElaB/YqjD/DUF883 family membrane-anchored ribosome-binding protein